MTVGMRIRSVDTTTYDEEIFIRAEGTYVKGSCVHCAADTDCVHRHGSMGQKFKDISSLGKKVSIQSTNAGFNAKSAAYPKGR